MAFFRSEWPVGLKVVKLSCFEAWNEDAPNVAPAVGRRIKFDDPIRLAIGDAAIQQHPHRRGGAAVHDELHPRFLKDRSIRKRVMKLHVVVRTRHYESRGAGRSGNVGVQRLIMGWKLSGGKSVIEKPRLVC